MQIVRGGKVSQLHDLLVIRGKTFAIVQQFKTPYNKKEKFARKPLQLRLIRANHENFSPRTICIIWYHLFTCVASACHLNDWQSDYCFMQWTLYCLCSGFKR